MAWIERRGQHRWRARYRGPDGRERSRTFARRVDAERFTATVEADKARGQWTDPRLARTTVGAYVTEWASTKADVGPRTRINIEGRIANHIVAAFGARAIGSLRPGEIRSWVASLTAQGLAPSTVKATYRTFSQILKTAEIDGLIHRSPCVGIELPAETGREEMHFLNPEQVAALAGAIDERYRAAILTAAYTGLRAGELWALKLARVDLLKRSLEVVESLSEVRGKLVTGPTKTRTRRTVSLPAFLAEELGQHIGRYPSEAGYVFTAAKGGPVRHRSFSARHFEPIVHRDTHGLEIAHIRRSEGQGASPRRTPRALPTGLRFHDLRHTCAAILIAEGWQPKQIQARLGHASIRTTLDNYGHLYEGHDRELLEGLDATYRAASVRPGSDQEDS